MSNAIFNRVGQDSMECEMITFGKNIAECYLERDLLDGSLNYHFGITSLNVPLNKVPIHPVSVDTPILILKRRNPGAYLNVSDYPYADIYNEFVKVATSSTQAEMLAFHTGPNGNDGGILLNNQVYNGNTARTVMYDDYADIFNNDTSAPLFGREPPILLANGQVVTQLTQADQIFVISPNAPHYTVSQFLASLTNWVQKFNSKMHREGFDDRYFNIEDDIDPVTDFVVSPVEDYLQILVTADTTIEFVGHPVFWNNFAIELSTYGIALLGINKDDLLEHNGQYFITRTDETFKAGLIEDGSTPPIIDETLQVDYNEHDATFSSSTPLFQSADQRISCSVSCHLPMQSHLLIRDGIQSTSREIAKAYFENEIQTTLTLNVYGLDSVKIKCKTYADQYHMIKKTDPRVQWNRLVNSYDLRWLRFYLHVTYKLFQNDKFVMVTEDLKVDDDSYWQFTVQFISDY
jgi:hypothetical protein